MTEDTILYKNVQDGELVEDRWKLCTVHVRYEQ